MDKLKGLVIDDDYNILEMCQTRFRSYLFVGVHDLDSAMDFITSREVCHFILLDYKLGKDNGFNLIDCIRKHRVIIPIIVLSAHSNKEVLFEAIQKKPDAFIEKPIDFKLLEQTISKLAFKCFPEKRTSYSLLNAVQSIIADFQKFDSAVFNKDLSVYAKDHNVSYKSLSALFKIETGRSFRRYLIDRKVEYAKQLLYSSDLSVIEIASRLGYWNPSSFMKIFKKELGKTPEEFRRSVCL